MNFPKELRQLLNRSNGYFSKVKYFFFGFSELTFLPEQG